MHVFFDLSLSFQPQQAIKIALELKKQLVDGDRLEITQVLSARSL